MKELNVQVNPCLCMQNMIIAEFSEKKNRIQAVTILVGIFQGSEEKKQLNKETNKEQQKF